MIVALLMTSVLLALSMGLVVLTNVETAVSANFRRATEALQAADAGIEIGITRLAASDWSVVLAQPEPTPCIGPEGATLAPTAFYRTDWWADSPVWRLCACVRIGDLGPGLHGLDPGLVVAVWLADDASEADGDPLADTNRRLTVRAEATAWAGAHAAVEATAAHAGSEVRTLSWRALR